MSSYLNIYLVPKRKDKKETKQHLLLSSYSRNNDVYEVFYENIHPIFSGGEEDKYTTLTLVNIQEVLDDLNKSIQSTQERLDLYDKYAKDNQDYIQDILSTREIIQDYQSTYNIVCVLKDIIDNTVNGYNDFEAVCCNIN